MAQLWGGRFTKETDQLVYNFNASISFDQKFYKQDIEGSIAHVRMLGKQGILTQEEMQAIVSCLQEILADVESGKLAITSEYEDIHSFVEANLIDRLGDTGKKLHTGRSRNDQVALDMRLYTRQQVLETDELLEQLLQVLLRIMKENTQTIMPGFTHLQKAQPITLAHHMGAYFEMFKRDRSRMHDIYERMNYCPLGSGALAGTTYPLDREYTAELLGFYGPTLNSMDGVSDRDYLIEYLSAMATIMMHLSRFSEEIIIWNSNEYKFVEIDDAYSTGSSIMPQKKNPDIAELVRGKTGRVYVPASALDRRPRKKDKKKNKTEAVVTPPAAPVAEQQAAPEPEEPELPDPAEVQYDDMTLGLTAEQADSLVAVWRERQCGDSYQEFFDNYILVDSTAESTTPDSVYIQRLRALVSPIQLPYNSIVRGYINRYTDSRYGTISRILGMSQYYFPLIEDELLKEELPVELRALPIIESALSTTAVSPMGAVGLWQFMPSTGKSYGLEVNSLVDERRDPVRSTQAACRYLKDLYAIYNDWSLAIAAYNCGPGNVNKAIARSGGNGRTFWDIYDYLPRETRGYVPAFIGASYAYAYHRQHGIELTESPIPLATDTIRIDRLMHLGQIASTIDIPIETLRQLNPQYKLDIIPATTKPYTLVLPQRNITQYIANEPAIFAKDSAYLKEYINPANIDKKRQERSGTVYVVKKGDTLGAIARRYRVTTAQLMRWNGIKNAHKLRLGQRIRIEGR